MSSLLGELMNNARKADISFGIHDNVIITSVDNEPRKSKDGEPIKRNCFTTFSQLDEKGKIVAEKEISWFNLNNTTEYVYDNFFNQLEQMTAIIDVYYGDAKKDKWSDAFSAVLEEFEIEEGDDTPEGVKQLELDLAEALKDKKTCEGILKGLGDAYVKLLNKKVGKDSQPMRLKVVYEKNGKYLQQPKYGPFVESMEVAAEDTRLKITKTEEEYRQKSLVAPSAAPAVSVGKL